MKINKIIALGLSLVFVPVRSAQSISALVIKEMLPSARSVTFNASRFAAGVLTRAALCKLDPWIVDKTKKYIAHPRNVDKVTGIKDMWELNWGLSLCVPGLLNRLTSKAKACPVSWLASERPFVDFKGDDASGWFAFLMGQVAAKRVFGFN